MAKGKAKNTGKATGHTKKQHASQPKKAKVIVKQVSAGISNAKTMGKNVGRMAVPRTETGTDLLFEVNTGAVVSPVASILGNVAVNPMTLIPNARLAQFAPLFEKFKVNSLTLRYVPAVSEMFSGDAIIWHSANPLTPWTEAGVPLEQRLSAQAYRLSQPVGKKLGATLHIPGSQFKNAKDFEYYVDPEASPDQTTCYAGRIYFGQKGQTVTNTNYGTWYVDWSITFYDPALNQEIADEGMAFNGVPSTVTNPLGAPWTILNNAKAVPVTVTATGSATQIVFGEIGIYNISYFTTGSGGAGLTSTTNFTGTGCTFTNFITYPGSTQTQKSWFYTVSVTVPFAVATFADTGGQTHPNGIGFGSIVVNRANAPLLTQAEKNQLIMKHKEDNIQRQLADLDAAYKKFTTFEQSKFREFLEHTKSPPKLSLPGEMDSSYTFTASDGGNNPPITVTGTSHTTVGTLDVVVLPPPGLNDCSCSNCRP